MNTLNESAPREILLVEDNAADADLVVEAFRDAPVPVRVTCVGDAASALSSLHAGHLPALIILDLKLPDRSGDEVLVEIKADPVLRYIPVVIFSSSHSEADVARAYEHCANCYVVKPAELREFLMTSQTIANFWFGVAATPAKDGRA
jgi:CheY-like chemotaxis protein